jgi:IS1 family transposase
VWTWTALDAESKLAVHWLVGTRDADTATVFMKELASRLANRVQLTADGWHAYAEAVPGAFGTDIDFATLRKIYGTDPQADNRKYSPSKVRGVEVKKVSGDPQFTHINTSYVERQNLTIRMAVRRFTRLTNAFSKKVENLEYAVALHFMHYNFCRPYQTLASPYPTTHAMAAGISDHVWKVGEIVALIEARETSEKLAIASQSN